MYLRQSNRTEDVSWATAGLCTDVIVAVKKATKDTAKPRTATSLPGGEVRSRSALRAWLSRNHDRHTGIWLVTCQETARESAQGRRAHHHRQPAAKQAAGGKSR
jgi:hypothetical protein